MNVKPLTTLLLSLILCLVCASCSKDTNFVGKWKFVKGELDENSEMYKLLKGKMNLSPSTIKYGSLILKEDSTFYMAMGTEVKGFFTGQWKYESDSSLIRLFNNLDNRESVIVVRDKSEKQMKIVQTGIISVLDDFIFILDKDEKYPLTYDYTTYEMNKWRIRAMEPAENDEVILNRVKNAFQFAISYLKEHQDEERLDMAELFPLPLKFASNGIQFQEEPNWNLLFFPLTRDTEATLSTDIIKQAFDKLRKVDIPEDVKNNPIKSNLYLLELLNDNLKLEEKATTE